MNLPDVIQRQIERLVELGFHRRLGLTAEAYGARFPRVEEQPGSLVGRFDLLVAVEASPLIELAWQHAALGIKNAVERWPLNTTGPEPDAPYLIWTHDGTRYSTSSIAEARGEYSEGEIGCSQLEVTSLFIHYPGLFRGRGLDADRTTCIDGYHSTLVWVQDVPELAAHHRNDHTMGLSVLTRARMPGED
jgi:hypothetical protein